MVDTFQQATDRNESSEIFIEGIGKCDMTRLCVKGWRMAMAISVLGAGVKSHNLDVFSSLNYLGPPSPAMVA